MNVLPIPALDGGRLWLMLISRVLKTTQPQARRAYKFGWFFGANHTIYNRYGA
jgi:membrane-associated protease RseP (regulator of RpoE activity)